MPLDSNDIATLHVMSEGGIQTIPTDSGFGHTWRPFAHGQQGGRVATLETLYDFWINYVPDPDEALAQDPDFLNKLYQHPDVAAAWEKRAKTVSQFEERIEANPRAPNQKVADFIAKEVSAIWEQIPNRLSLYYEMQRAVLAGGIGIEFVWHTEANGLQRPVQFFPVDKSRFVFDRLGNMALYTRHTPVWGSYIEAARVDKYIRTAFPRGKFVYHVYRRRPGTWQRPNLEGYIYFGQGDDVPLYYVVTFDFFVLRFRMKWLEKFGIPPYVLYHPDNQAVSDQIRAIGDSLRGESLITIPKKIGGGDENKTAFYSLEPLNVPAMGYDAFANFSSSWTQPKVYNILLGQSDASEPSETGSFSAHVSRFDTGPSVFFKYDAKNISASLNAQILPSITLQRFPNLPQVYWPVHTFNAKEERDREQEMKVALDFAKMAPIASEEFYERGGFRRPSPGEATVGGEQKGGIGEQLDLFGGEGKPVAGGMPPRRPIGQNGNGQSAATSPARQRIGK